MPSYSSAVLPTSNGLGLGTASLRWAPYFSNIDISGTITFNGPFTCTTLTASGAVTTATQLISTVSTGTPPLSVSSTTRVQNLNVDLLDGNDWTIPGTIGSTTPNTGAFTTLSATGQITSTLVTGTAPLVVASTTQVSNLNVSQLVGATWASPAAIGTGTPAAITSTVETVNTSLAVGGGTAITKIVVYSQSLAPAQVNANTTSAQTFTVTGISTSDKLFVNKPTHQAGLGIVNCFASSSNTLQITFMNNTASPITPTTETYAIFALRS